jgi:hypothetical protein
VDDGLHYGLDFGPTLLSFLGVDYDGTSWDGESFAESLTAGTTDGREFLVLGNCAWTCQRSVRWDDWLLVRTYHDAGMDIPPVSLFDLAADPHETTDLAPDLPEVVAEGLALRDVWHDRVMLDAVRGRAGGNPAAPDAATDPLWQVLAEGGPFHPRGPSGDRLREYAVRLRETGRESHAERLDRTDGFVDGDVTPYLP